MLLTIRCYSVERLELLLRVYLEKYCVDMKRVQGCADAFV